jgi:hypothetical protein
MPRGTFRTNKKRIASSSVTQGCRAKSNLCKRIILAVSAIFVHLDARFYVFTAMKIQVEIFWVVTLCSVVRYQRFIGPCCLRLEAEVILNITAVKASKLLSFVSSPFLELRL